jgi:molybdenum cofactor sulfurtransferase
VHLQVRDLVLKFFNADPAEYQVVFTRSATGALKLVGETFPWSRASTFAYLRENHNSVLGMREYALEAGTRTPVLLLLVAGGLAVVGCVQQPCN